MSGEVESEAQNRTARVSLAWGDGQGEGGDGQHIFRLGIGELRELQELCDAGPREIATRLAGGRERVNDIFETLRLGLIGGGMTPAKAKSMVKRYGEDRPLQESIPYAQAVILAAIVGASEEPSPGKAEAAEPTSFQEENSASPPYTEAGPL